MMTTPNAARICATFAILALANGAAEHERLPPFEATLVYSGGASPVQSLSLKSNVGSTYRLSLVPEMDVLGHPIVLELVLGRAGDKSASNLFDTTGKLHGYQPYVFAASDFVDGASRSAYGEVRIIDAPQLSVRVQVRIANVSVAPTGETQPGGYTYQFRRLELQIGGKPLPDHSGNGRHGRL